MVRKTRAEAQAILDEEVVRAGWDTVSSFKVESGARAETNSLDWWHQNTSEHEQADTRRSIGYLRAYLRIGGDRLFAGGLLLDQKRLWMDRSIVSRLERDGYLRFVEHHRDPYFELTKKGKNLLEQSTI